jgi:hypothetical protein
MLKDIENQKERSEIEEWKEARAQMRAYDEIALKIQLQGTTAILTFFSIASILFSYPKSVVFEILGINVHMSNIVLILSAVFVKYIHNLQIFFLIFLSQAEKRAMQLEAKMQPPFRLQTMLAESWTDEKVMPKRLKWIRRKYFFWLLIVHFVLIGLFFFLSNIEKVFG